jgi:hypothetical protein
MSLTEARKRNPPPAVAGWMAGLRQALFDEVKEADVAAVFAKLKAMALKGDLSAMKLFLQYTVGAATAERPVQQPPITINAANVSVPEDRPRRGNLQTLQAKIVRLLAERGPLDEDKIAVALDAGLREVLDALDSEWFDHAAAGYHITTLARKDML